MNQILITGDEGYIQPKQKKQKQPKMPKQPKKEKSVLEVNTIVIFYAISIMILGICMISGSVYAKDRINETVEASIKPSVEISRNDENNTVDIKVSHIRGIQTIKYHWNNENDNIVNGNSQKNLIETIDLLGGTNTLTVTVTEDNGQSVTYNRQFIVGNIPEIKLEAVSNGIKVTAKSENEIDYVSYRWDNGEETSINVEDQNYEGIITTLKGEHTLEIRVVDKNGSEATKTQVVVGATAPTVKISADIIDGKVSFIIDVEDEEEISTVEITLNDGEKQVIEVNSATYHQEVEMVSGENKILITAYNESGLETTKGAKFKNE